MDDIVGIELRSRSAVEDNTVAWRVCLHVHVDVIVENSLGLFLALIGLGWFTMIHYR